MDLNASCILNNPSLYSNPTPCLLLLIMIKCIKPMTIKIQTLFDFGAYACLIDKESISQHKLVLMKKIHYNKRCPCMSNDFIIF